MRDMQRGWRLGRVLLPRMRDAGERQRRMPEDYKFRKREDGPFLSQESGGGDNRERGKDVLVA